MSASDSVPISCAALCPSGQDFGLHVAIVRSDHPVGCAVNHRIAERFETRDGEAAAAGPSAGPKPLSVR